MFIAESGTYGFYTDNGLTYPVSFQYDLGGVKYSGNYTSNNSGMGWTLDEDQTYERMFKTLIPRWVIIGEREKGIRRITVAEHLKRYQTSSKYKEY